MATITTPASIFEHTLDPIAGYDIQPAHRLDYSTKISANVTILPWAGRVVHLNSVGEWEMGCKANAMPCFLMPLSYPIGHMPTVTALNPGSGWISVGGFTATALPAVGGYELATTEFDATKTYLPNNFLTAKVSNTDQDTGGLLTNVAPGSSTVLTPPWAGGGTTKTICGQVTRPAETLKNGNSVLSFWGVYFPGSTDA